MFQRYCIAASIALAAAGADFQRDIRPILSNKCFQCHGPDEAARKANLRLDDESASRAAIKPGDPAGSKLLARVSHDNKALRMPPAYAKLDPLTAREVDAIRTWITEGARYEKHWAFRAPARPEPPAVSNPRWVRNPIDSFVLARLDREGLKPSPEAPRATLLRRASLDITGIPPSLAELDSREPYESTVERLLGSPRYGERMAIDWLDAARYADTHGYQVDPRKEMWAWRDWVIRAYNRNLPFDQFTVEQIAGDMLPGATLDQKVASGFHRNHRVNTEAGSIAEEFHAENVVDRVSTTGTVWLGLTIGCSRCHDHKYDPITMRDFYSMFAVFNSVPEVGTGGPRDGRGNLKPYLRLPAPEIEAKIAKVDEEIAAARKNLRDVEASLPDPPASLPDARWTAVKPREIKSEGGVSFRVLDDGSILASGARPDRDIITMTADVAMDRVTAFQVELLPDPSLPGGCSGRGDSGRSALTVFEARLDGAVVALQRATASYATADSFLDRVITPQPQIKRGWSVGAECAQAQHLILETTKMSGAGKAGVLSLKLGNEHGDGWLMGRFRVSFTDSEFPVPLAEAGSAVEGRRLRQDGASSGMRPVAAKLDRKFYVTRLRPYRVANERVQALTQRKTALENQLPSTMVMTEMEAPRDTHLLLRGQYDKQGDKVTADVPAFLRIRPAGGPVTRLEFARWLVDPANPLTARVAVNRLWQQVFGTGLVRTSEDFGSQGEAPSHPELLDWLATEYVRTGWDTKAMLRLMVTSSTYRQSSVIPAALGQRDPENRLLARGPRFRLGAEIIRDQALFASGLLREKEGGPPVKPYQPAGVWDYVSLQTGEYVLSKGDDLYRRGLYTYWKRTIPPPALMTFDAPTREFCVVRRSRSSTPLQALALLNDETYVEASRVLAERMIRSGAAPGARIAHGFRLATARIPSEREKSVLQAGLERRLTHYRSKPDEAAALLKAGESARDKSIDPAELAAYATVASVILNLDEVVTKQ